MRLVATEYVSLDGVFEEPGEWSFPFFNDEAAQFKARELEQTDALLLGRKTYEGFAAAWPTMEGTGEFGEKMNSMPKYVVSSTLEEADWTGSILVKGDLATEIGKLKDTPGQDLLLSGSAQLFNHLEADAALGLIEDCALLASEAAALADQRVRAALEPLPDLPGQLPLTAV